MHSTSRGDSSVAQFVGDQFRERGDVELFAGHLRAAGARQRQQAVDESFHAIRGACRISLRKDLPSSFSDSPHSSSSASVNPLRMRSGPRRSWPAAEMNDTNSLLAAEISCSYSVMVFERREHRASRPRPAPRAARVRRNCCRRAGAPPRGASRDLRVPAGTPELRKEGHHVEAFQGRSARIETAQRGGVGGDDEVVAIEQQRRHGMGTRTAHCAGRPPSRGR